MNPHVILINSHGRLDNEPIKIYPYRIYQQNLRNVHLSDGVAIAVRHDVPHKVTRDFTSEVMAVTLMTTQGEITIATCYFPPSRPYLPMRDLNRLSNIQHPVYLLGDMNARHVALGHSSENPIGRQLANRIHNDEWQYLGPDFRTFHAHSWTSKPDIVLCNRNAFFNYVISPGPPSTSDHIPVVLEISANPIAQPCTPRPHYKSANWDLYKTEIDSAMTTPNLDGKTVDEIEEELSRWYERVLAAKEKAIPKKNFKITPHANRSPLLNDIESDIRALLEEGRVQGWSREKYARLKTYQRRLLVEAKRLHVEKWDSLLKATADKVKEPWEFWSRLRRLKGTKTSSPVDYLVDEHGREVFEAEQREHVMRQAWQKVFRISDEENADFNEAFELRVQENLTRRANEISTHASADLSRLNEDDLYLCPITQEDVVRAIKRFKKRKAPGSSGIKQDDLKNLPMSAITALTNIFNASFSAGYFPQRFKAAQMVFIPKAGKNHHEPLGNRPISLLETPGKIYERVLADRLITYTETNNIMDPNQYGFRHRRGTTRAIALTYEQIAVTVSEKGTATLILRDLEKAFDKVWYPGLKDRLLEIRTPDLLLRTLCNFLDGRSASVRLGSYVGPPFALHAGVPQGSILSPTLFITYTSDSPPPTVSENHTAYADDHSQLVMSFCGNKNRHARLTVAALRRRKIYERDKKFSNNVDKMKIIVARRRFPVDVIVDGEEMTLNEPGKLLGCQFGIRGVRAQAADNVAKGKAQLAKLRRFRAMSSGIKRYLYITIVRPVLEYPPVPLHTLSRSALLEIQKVQNRALRWIHVPEPVDRRTTNQELHRMYRLQPMNIRLHYLAQRIWERVDEDDDVNLQRILQMEDHVREGAEHYWWPWSRRRAFGAPPRPIFTQLDVRLR